MHKVGEDQKCTEWPQTELEHLTDKNSLYTLNLPLRPKFGPFRSTISGFRKSEIHQMTTNWTWTLNTLWTPEVQILVRFALRLAVSEKQGCKKSKMHWVTQNWTWTLNSQKYSIYTKDLPVRSKFGPFRFATRGFQDIAHFINPHWLPC